MSLLSDLGRAIGWLFLALVGCLIFIQAVVRLAKRWVHFPAPPCIAVFLNSRLRRRIQPPEQVIGPLDLQPGMQVVEIGPGGGAFTVDAARRVGPAGQVHAFDIQPAMIERLEAHLGKAGVGNVSAQVASAYELPLPAASMDRAFMVTVLSEVPDKGRALAEIRRVLKPDGRLAIGELVFDPDYPLRRTVIRWCRDAGFELIQATGGLLHYVLVFKPCGGD